MKLTPIDRLVPHVTEIDRLVFSVPSRSNGKKLYRVDLEARHGLGRCDCADATMNKNPSCWHLQKVRAYVACKVAQAVINSTKPK